MKIHIDYKKLNYDQLMEKLNSNWWNKFDDFTKISILSSLFVFEKNQISIPHNIAFEISNDKNLYNVNGEYHRRDKKIVINKDVLKEDGHYVNGIILHELYHAYQDYLSNKKNDNNDNFKIELLSFCQNKLNEPFHFLNFNNNGNFNIQPVSSSFENIFELSKIFYYLNIGERTAQEYQYDYLDKHNCFYKNNITNYIKNFNEHYRTFLSKEQSCKLIDSCYYNLSQNIEPETDLEASVMYDICCLALLENDKISELECRSMLEDNYKKVQLAEYGYCLNEEDRYGKYVITNSLKEKVKEYTENKDEFAKLTPFQQRDNPYIILCAIMHFQDEIKDYIVNENLDYLFAYAARNKEYLYPIVREKLLEWYPEKYHEYLDEDEIEL